MKRTALLMVCLAALLWVACEEEVPDYVGTWQDSTTLVAVGTTVTFDLGADAGMITIDKPDPAEDVVIEGNLAKSGSTLTATITKITVGATEYTGAMLDAFLAALTPPLTTVNDFTYSVVGNTLTITGDLIDALTGGIGIDTLIAVKI